MSIIETLNEKFPIRKSRKQKDAFRTWFIAWAQEQGYAAEATKPKGLFGSSNVVVGDPETAQVVFTGHFDTPAVMPVPNFITPRNVLVYILYQVVMLPVMLAPGILIGAGAGWLGGYVSEEVGFLCGYFTTMALMIVTFCLLMFGPANKHNVNDNTSGVAAVLETMARIPVEQRPKIAFILFDNEEKGCRGSKAYAREHLQMQHTKLVVNLDCVGVGEHFIVSSPALARNLDGYELLERVLSEDKARTAHFFSSVTTRGNSDYRSFKCGVGVSAYRMVSGVGFYTGAIHTARDTQADQGNIEYLAQALSGTVSQLPEEAA